MFSVIALRILVPALAMLEVCGMNPWLLDMLREYGCREIVVIQPTGRSKQKTHRRDAGELSPWLWVHAGRA